MVCVGVSQSPLGALGWGAGARDASANGCPSCPPAAAERVLQRPHQLQDAVLTVNPHYPFLESPEETPALDPAPLPDTDPGPDTCPDPAEPLPLSPVLGELPAAPPGGDVATERDQRQHWEPVSVPAEMLMPTEPVSVQGEVLVLAEPSLVQDEVVVPAEPGAVRYLQRHYRDLLDSIPEVLLVPLEGGDIAGFRVSHGQGAGGRGPRSGGRP